MYHNLDLEKNKSTLDAIDKYLAYIYESLNVGKYVATIYIDFKKAFDSRNHDILLETIRETGVTGTELAWMKSYLSNRSQCVTVNGTLSELVTIDYGVPQGSTLGPLFFIVYANSMALSLTGHSMVMYADDTAIFGADKNLARLLCNTTKNTESIMLRCRKNKLSINIQKTKAMIFCQKIREKMTHKELKIGNQNIEIVHEYSYLGIRIDDKLNFTPHLKSMLRNLSYKKKQFKRIRKFIDQKVAINIYKTMIAPIFSYANAFLFSAPQKLLKKLQTQQNQSIRTIFKVSRRTNIDAQRSSLNILTVENEQKVSLLCLAYKKSFNISLRDTRNANTRAFESGRRQLILNRPLNEKYKKSYIYNSKRWWNELPTWHHKQVHIGLFKRCLCSDVEYLNSLSV